MGEQGGTFMDTLNERIKQLRKEKGLTQSQLADLLGVTDKAVSKWEVGETNPDISLLPKISEIFNVTLDYLLVGKKEENLSLDDMDATKRFHYLIKKDDVDSFSKYYYGGVGKENSLFSGVEKFDKYNFKMINSKSWMEIINENSNKILSYAFDLFLKENNADLGYCLSYFAASLLDDFIIKAIDLDRVDIIEALGVKYTHVKSSKSNPIYFYDNISFKMPLIVNGDIRERANIIIPEIKRIHKRFPSNNL